MPTPMSTPMPMAMSMPKLNSAFCCALSVGFGGNQYRKLRLTAARELPRFFLTPPAFWPLFFNCATVFKSPRFLTKRKMNNSSLRFYVGVGKSCFPCGWYFTGGLVSSFIIIRVSSHAQKCHRTKKNVNFPKFSCPHRCRGSPRESSGGCYNQVFQCIY